MGVNGVSGQDFAALSVSAARSVSAPQVRTNKADPPFSAHQRITKEQTEEQVQPTAKTLVESAGPKATHATMSVDKESNRVVVRIYDDQDQLIKQVPPEELLDIAKSFRKLEGVIFDEQT
jgi:flagellar protein FlaG